MSKFDSTILPQTNDPKEIQKMGNDLLEKINTTYAQIASAIAAAPSVIIYSKDALYTPQTQGFGTISGVNFFWSRVGNRIKGIGKFTAGTVTGSEARIYLPVINSVQLLSDSALIPSLMPCGMFFYSNAAATPKVVLIGSGLGYINVANINAANAFSVLAGNQAINTGETGGLYFELPVSGWN